jgi:hypothetical protein
VRLAGACRQGRHFIAELSQQRGAGTAVQLSLVLESVVPEAANPVGALGLVAHELARVVTFTAELAAEVPAAPVASTAKLLAVEGVRPVTASEVVVGDAIRAPFCRTL